MIVRRNQMYLSALAEKRCTASLDLVVWSAILYIVIAL